MTLSAGTTLGSYTVSAKLGEGGMGEAYRARDTQLDRKVALKVLPEAIASDPERLATAVWPALASLALGLPIAFGTGWLSRPESQPPEPPISPDLRVRKLTFEPGLESVPSPWLNGNTLAYVTDDRGPLEIVLLPLDGGEPRRKVASDTNDAQQGE